MLKLILILTVLNISVTAEKTWYLHIIDGNGSGADGVRLADINGDNLPDTVTGWEESGVTRIYLNPGKEKVKARWPVAEVGKTKSVEDAFLQDLDGDGQPEVITCCEGKEKSVFIHWSPGKDRLLLKNSWQQMLIPSSKNLTSWMFAQAMQVDDKAGIDIISRRQK